MMIFTIGHSNHALATFTGYLKDAGAACVVDVRASPGSRYNPQFNSGALRDGLTRAGIGYRHLPELGGRRGSIDTGSDNLYWPEGPLRNYADYAQTAAFRAALEVIGQLAQASSIAIMCAEGAWRKCHRQIVADYLLADGLSVQHILPDGTLEVATLNPAARPKPGGGLTYRPANPELPLFG